MANETEQRTCLFLSCENPSATAYGFGACEEHAEAWRAEYMVNAWGICRDDLLPAFKQMARLFDNEPLDEILDAALERAEREYVYWQQEDERLHVR